MKSLRHILAISLVLLSFSIFALHGKAQEAETPLCSNALRLTMFPCVTKDGTTVSSQEELDKTIADAQAQASNTAKRGVKVCPEFAYTVGGFIGSMCDVVDFSLGAIGGMLAGLMFLCATLFDYSVDKFILKISTLFLDSANTAGGGNKAYIYNTWATVRDLANIAAFFAAVYAGFLRIIGQNQEDFRKAVAKLVIFALLTNFSFALSKAAIDLANVVSLQFYGAAAGYKFADNISKDDKGYVVSDYGISTAFAQNMGLSDFVVNTSKVNQNSAFASLDSVTVVFVSYVFFIFVGWQFLAMAIFVLARSFMLIVSVVLSPLMFIGGLVPPLTKIHDKWREMFFGNLVVAPIIMLFIWLILTILSALQTAFKTAPLAATTSIQTMLQQIALLTIAGLSLHFGKKYAEQFSGAAGQFAVNVLGGAVGGMATAAATGGAGFVARAGMARAAAVASGVGKTWVEKEGAGKMRKFAGGMLLKGGERLEKTEVFGKSAFGIRKAAEEKINDKRSQIMREHGDAAKVGGWRDKLGQAKTEKELAYVQDQIRQGKNYDPAVHDVEMKNINNRPPIKSDGLRVLDKDKLEAVSLQENIKARDLSVEAKIKTEQSQIRSEEEELIKTLEEHKANQKLDGVSPDGIKKTQDGIDRIKKEMAEKLEAVKTRLEAEKNAIPDYVGWKESLAGLELEKSKTTLAYKAGANVGEVVEKNRQRIESDARFATPNPSILGNATAQDAGFTLTPEESVKRVFGNDRSLVSAASNLRNIKKGTPVQQTNNKYQDNTNYQMKNMEGVNDNRNTYKLKDDLDEGLNKLGGSVDEAVSKNSSVGKFNEQTEYKEVKYKEK